MNGGLRAKIKKQKVKSGRLRNCSFSLCALCFLFYAFFLLFALPGYVLSSEESEGESDQTFLEKNFDQEIKSSDFSREGKDSISQQESKTTKTVSITAGPDGKVTWLFGKNLGTAHGNAVVKYEDVTLKAEHIWADLDTEVVEAQGNVNLQMKDQTITAESLVFDLKNKKGIMKEGMSFDDPWYNAGREMSRFNEDDSLIRKGSMTSCSLSEPHYFFEASNIVIHLKKELIAKHVVFKVGGVPLLYLPIYRRSLEPEKPSRFIFRIGSNTYEGYYAKSLLPVRWRMIDGSLFFDYTTRRGMKGGLKFDYDLDKIRLREIFLPVLEDASSEEWRSANDRMNEILKRAQGDLDKIWIKEIYIKYQIDEADRNRARKNAEEVLEKAKEEDADFYQLARRWSSDADTKTRGGYLGSFVIDEEGIMKKEGTELTPVESKLLPIVKAAAELEPGKVADALVELEEGYSVVKLDARQGEEIRLRHILIAFEPSERAQDEAQDKADDILTRLSGEERFEELAKIYSDDQETADKGGDLGWKTFQDLDISFHTTARTLEKGEISGTIRTSRGIYILKLEDKEKTPDFADLAQEYSQAPSAEFGGDIGYRNKWELDPKIRRDAFRLEIGEIGKPIKTEDGYRIVKVEKKRRLGGDVYIDYGELYSYQIEQNPIKLGNTWNVDIHHNQTLWRGGEQREEGTAQLRMEKSLSMRAELSLAGKEYKQIYQSYRPERELRSYCAFDYYWRGSSGSSGRSRLILDGTRDLLGEDTGAKQKYPEFTFQSPNYQLHKLQPFKGINSGFKFVSDRIQGRADFAELARQISDDKQTGEKGGDLGWFERQESQLGSTVETAIFNPNKFAPGDITAPISVKDGYHIVKIEDVEEKAGRRERVKARHIFIAIDPDIRTKDEASKLADQIYRKLVEGERPSLGFLTLDNTSFSFNVDAGNYYKDKYRDETNIWLQTSQASVRLNKRAIIRLGVTRELNLDLGMNYSETWHSKTQKLKDSLDYGVELDPSEDPNRRDKNVFSGSWNSSASLGTNLHRIYYPSFVPGVYAMRHTISPYARFYYSPPGESEKRGEEQEPELYPFVPAAWVYEQKKLTIGMTNSIDIKTKRKRERLALFRWSVDAGADYTKEEDDEYRYDRIQNSFTLMPHKQVTLKTMLQHNPNNIGTNDPLLITYNSDLTYNDAQRRWTGYLRWQNVYNGWSQQWSQFYKGSVDLRWSRNWSLNFELEYEYDDQVKDIYFMDISLHRMLHCWESRIVFRRRGTKVGSIRKDFYFQIDLLADPGKALGVGYDEASKSWTLRSLPGVGGFGRFLRPGGSAYYY